MAQQSDQMTEAVAGRAGLVAEMHAVEPVGDPRYDATHVGCRSIDLAEETNFSLPACFSNRMAFLSWHRFRRMLPYNLPRFVLL